MACSAPVRPSLSGRHNRRGRRLSRGSLVARPEGSKCAPNSAAIVARVSEAGSDGAQAKGRTPHATPAGAPFLLAMS